MKNSEKALIGMHLASPFGVMRSRGGLLGVITQFFLALGFFATCWANQAPVIDSVIPTSTVVQPGATITLNLSAHDPDCPDVCTSGCGQYIRFDLTQWTAADGVLSNIDNGTSASPYTASAQWTAPAIEGTYTIDVSVGDSGTLLCGGRLYSPITSVPIQVSNVPNDPPVIQSLTSDLYQLQPGQVANLVAVASDPNGDALSYDWTATAGTVTAGSPGIAVFTAAATPGIVTVTCTVTDARGAIASKSLALSVIDIIPETLIASNMAAPQRVSTDSFGYIFATDRASGGVSVIQMATGRAAFFLEIPDITSSAADWNGNLLVGTKRDARLVQRNGTPGPVLEPENLEVTDVTVDPVRRRYAVLYGEAGRVKVFDENGALLFAFGANGDGAGEFRGASGIAVDPASGRILVADSGHGLIHVFDSGGQIVFAFGGRGSGPGQFTKLQGIAVDGAGLVYGVDAFETRIQVFQSDGSFREMLGTYGAALGEFITPSGITVAREYGKLVVASLNTSSLHIFALPVTSPPPFNTPPSVPAAESPQPGTELPWGSTVLLAARNSVDPDYQALQYQFEVFDSQAQMLASITVPESPDTTSADVTAAVASVSGNYSWHVRAYDGVAYSDWSALQDFSIGPRPANLPPTTPVPQNPLTGGQAATAALLVTGNATDADNDPLTYDFEVALLQDGAPQTVLQATNIVEENAATSLQLDCGVLMPGQKAYWRVRAFDGSLYSDWSPYQSFLTPGYPPRWIEALGHVPNGDTMHREQVHYELGARNADTTLVFEVFDINSDTELQLLVNENSYVIPAQQPAAWSAQLALSIPAAQLNPNGGNVVRFIHADTSDPWGVRHFSATPPESIAPDPGPDRPPGTPALVSPRRKSQEWSLTPSLTVRNTSDPDGNSLNYSFELAIKLDGNFQTLVMSPDIPEGAGETSWPVPCGILQPGQKVYWRARASDGLLAGSWTGYRYFWTVPVAIPSERAYGNLPDGDETRPAGAIMVIGPASADVTLGFDLYDIWSDRELKVVINGAYVHPIRRLVPGMWSDTQVLVIPAAELSATGNNLIQFLHHGLSNHWGIRNISVSGGAP